MQAGDVKMDMEIGQAERLLAGKTCWTLADQGWVYDGGHLKRKAAKETKEAVAKATAKKTTKKK